MMIDIERLETHIPEHAPNSLQELNPGLRLYKDGKVECWYAPLGQINKRAMIALYGVTPGWTQMKIAYQIAIQKNKGNSKPKAMSRIAFAGAMRKNLVNMLDELRIATHLKVDSFGELFGSDKLAYSSIFKYPVFVNGKNYTGHTPNFLKHAFLRSILETSLASELTNLRQCLIIPLGKAANEGITFVRERAKLEGRQILSGFPHPSGANAHRRDQFQRNKTLLTTQIDEWFESIYRYH